MKEKQFLYIVCQRTRKIKQGDNTSIFIGSEYFGADKTPKKKK